MMRDRSSGEKVSGMLRQGVGSFRPRCCGIKDGRQNVAVNPFNNRNANRITEAVHGLVLVVNQLEVTRALQASVLAGRHPPHPQFPVLSETDDLAGAAAL